MNETIRSIVAAHGKLNVPMDQLSDSDDLFLAGLSSLNVVSIMLAIEDHLDIEMPEELLRRATFQSVDALVAAISDLQVEAA